ncbi:MAG: LuxR C-terminal-related transcriptional regulator [Candidatus Dormibacteraeota bacterium]|nr:LuxR C-terminal-related transcriptional regulator [Candidatus Dormibacteraeota bacterium]
MQPENDLVELSRRQREVAGLVAEGLSSRAIAVRLFISERTAEYHVEQIRNKLGFHSRADVAGWVREQDQTGSARIRAGNLPPPLTSFIGRGTELAELRTLLGRTRLVTLTGAGGVGKTRLAVKLAGGLPWPDGAWFVDLAAIGDPDLVWATLARSVEVTEWSGSTLSDAVGSHLATKSSLLLLDNCEHLLGAVAPTVVNLLSRCEKVHILATSREPLGVPGEVTWPVATLPVPDAVTSERPERLAENDAVRLFVERARLARPSFVLTPANAAAVGRITRRLDGLPLAIELAAARVRTMGPTEIEERLRDRFRLLTGGGRTSLPRQQTLRATLDWSYVLLSADERTVLNRLAVFAGGFSLNAAEQVCADEALPGERIWDLLSRLVEKSMVQREDRAGGSRYRLLETVLAFALDHAVDGPDLGDVRSRHGAFFLRLAEEAEPFFLGPSQVEWLERVGEEESNLRTAHEWFQEQAPELCLRLGAATRRLWLRRGRFTEGLDLGVRSLAVDTNPTVARAHLLSGVADLELHRGDYDSARAHLEESVRILREAEDLPGLAEALALSAAIRNMGYSDAAVALQLGEEALQVARTGGDERTLGLALNHVGCVWLMWGDTRKARAMIAEGVDHLRRSGDGFETANVLESLALATMESGDKRLAAALWAESLQMGLVLGRSANIAWCLNGFARLAAASDPGRALRLAAGAAVITNGQWGLALGQWEERLVRSWLAGARSSLDAASAAAAWRIGAAMPLEELVSCALIEPLLENRTTKREPK